MTTACHLLARAQQEGVWMVAAGDRLKLSAPHKPADDLLAALRAHKAELLALLSGEVRTWAEDFARLDLAQPPPGFTPQRWQQVVNDGSLFLDGWAAKAARLGWSAEDVFGVHPAAPGARYDCMGLVPLIGGGIVVSMTTDRATIRKVSGAELVYLRRPRPGAIALWKLEACEQ
jgi:hypothetical protein